MFPFTIPFLAISHQLPIPDCMPFNAFSHLGIPSMPSSFVHPYHQLNLMLPPEALTRHFLGEPDPQ